MNVSNLFSVVSENQHHFHCYLLRVLRRLACQLGRLAVPQGHQACDFQEAASQLQTLQELLETRVLPLEQGARREATGFPILSSEPRPGCACLPTLVTPICWLLLGVTSLASAFFTALYSLNMNKDQATSWAVSMMLSVLQDTFVSQPVKVCQRGRAPWRGAARESELHAHQRKGSHECDNLTVSESICNGLG
ncbi:polycystic kidney disease protein 1-like 3 [Perognathus longimembris pacificus]|uniref:polycystic kidney disease protein 1-like 3 n=1 Tax=Perognathus longimembris pacificus TaxID=214514 RepID=UPI0020198E95|nr:polycystic kidney disease protein 1-like 3 [Perognathus longimembris pacificus]